MIPARRKLRFALAAAAALLGLGRPAFAASSATLNIDITIAAELSVSVDGVASSSYTGFGISEPNELLASLTTATVRNDSPVRTARWYLSTNAESINAEGGAEAWTLSASTSAVAADQFAVQAVFGSSRTAAAGCPAAGSPDWDQAFAAPLSAAPQQYGAGSPALFVNPNLDDDGTPGPDLPSGHVWAGSQRALCWRVIGPRSTITTQTQNIQIVISAGAP